MYSIEPNLWKLPNRLGFMEVQMGVRGAGPALEHAPKQLYQELQSLSGNQLRYVGPCALEPMPEAIVRGQW